MEELLVWWAIVTPIIEAPDNKCSVLLSSRSQLGNKVNKTGIAITIKMPIRVARLSKLFSAFWYLLLSSHDLVVFFFQFWTNWQLLDREKLLQTWPGKQILPMLSVLLQQMDQNELRTCGADARLTPKKREGWLQGKVIPRTQLPEESRKIEQLALFQHAPPLSKSCNRVIKRASIWHEQHQGFPSLHSKWTGSWRFVQFSHSVISPLPQLCLKSDEISNDNQPTSGFMRRLWRMLIAMLCDAVMKRKTSGVRSVRWLEDTSMNVSDVRPTNNSRCMEINSLLRNNKVWSLVRLVKEHEGKIWSLLKDISRVCSWSSPVKKNTSSVTS